MTIPQIQPLPWDVAWLARAVSGWDFCPRDGHCWQYKPTRGYSFCEVCGETVDGDATR